MPANNANNIQVSAQLGFPSQSPQNTTSNQHQNSSQNFDNLLLQRTIVSDKQLFTTTTTSQNPENSV